MIFRMKNLSAFLFAGLQLIFLAPSIFAADRTIQVNGEAEVLVTPDKASIRAGIEYWDKNLAVARKSTDEALKKAIALAEEFKIAKESIQVEWINVELERRGWNEKPAHALEGYYVRRNVNFTLKNLDRFDDFLGRLLETGVNQIHGVDFQTSDLRKHRDAARELAMKAAQEKARDMAKAIGQKIGRANQINETQDIWSSFYGGYRGRAGSQMMQNVSVDRLGPDSSASAVGKISVKATVSAVFQLD